MYLKNKILIIHPEGNINNNPNLSGIVEVLCENDFLVTIYSPKKHFYQKSPHYSAKLTLRNSILEGYKWKLVNAVQNHFIISIIFSIFVRSIANYDFIIGVDQQGIIEANSIAKRLKIPYALISYEIMFRDESNEHFKNLEIRACNDITFAVCQDKLRGKKLSTENSIPLHKIIHIPVAGRGAKRGPKTKYLHKKLNIPSNKKIALYAGSLFEFAMLDELIDGLAYWPEQWVFVLHDRYGIFDNIANKIKPYIDTGRLYVSQDSISEHKDIHILLHAADIGIAFYRPTYKNANAGKNLEFLGLSSGKIATYLQHGLPIVTNEIGEMSDFIRTNDIGAVVPDISCVPDALNNLRDLEDCRNRCFTFFERRLDLNRAAPLLIDRIKSIFSQRQISKLRRLWKRS